LRKSLENLLGAGLLGVLDYRVMLLAAVVAVLLASAAAAVVRDRPMAMAG